MPFDSARIFDALLAAGAATRLTRFVVVEDLALWTIRDPARRWADRHRPELPEPSASYVEYMRLSEQRATLIRKGVDPSNLAEPIPPVQEADPGWAVKLVSGLECSYCVGTWLHLGWQTANLIIPRSGPWRAAYRILAAGLTGSYLAGHLAVALNDLNDDVVDAEIGEA